MSAHFEYVRRAEQEIAAGRFGDSALIVGRRRFLDAALLSVLNDERPGMKHLDVDDGLVRALLRRRADYRDDNADYRDQAFATLTAMSQRTERGKAVEEWQALVLESVRGAIHRACETCAGTKQTRHDPELTLDADFLPAFWRELPSVGWPFGETLGRHATSVAWVAPQPGHASFVSGTSPDLPGVLLLSTDLQEQPEKLMEAVVHEMAHCKFYDLCVVWGLFPGDDVDAASFDVPWRSDLPDRLRRWPLDQVLAACHAHIHISVLAYGIACRQGVERSAGDVERTWLAIGRRSAMRAGLLLDHLRGLPLSALGPDAPDFIEWVRRILALTTMASCEQGDTRGACAPYLSDDVMVMHNNDLGATIAVRRGSLESFWLSWIPATSALGIKQLVVGAPGSGGNS